MQHPSATGNMVCCPLYCALGRPHSWLVRPSSKARSVTVGTGLEHARLELIHPLSFAFWRDGLSCVDLSFDARVI